MNKFLTGKQMTNTNLTDNEANKNVFQSKAYHHRSQNLNTLSNIMSDKVFCSSSCGSIDVNYQLIFPTVDPPALQQLAQMLQKSLEVNGGLVSDEGTVFKIDETSIVFEGMFSSWLRFFP